MQRLDLEFAARLAEALVTDGVRVLADFEYLGRVTEYRDLGDEPVQERGVLGRRWIRRYGPSRRARDPRNAERLAVLAGWMVAVVDLRSVWIGGDRVVVDLDQEIPRLAVESRILSVQANQIYNASREHSDYNDGYYHTKSKPKV